MNTASFVVQAVQAVFTILAFWFAVHVHYQNQRQKARETEDSDRLGRA